MRLAARRIRPRAFARHFTATAFTASRPFTAFFNACPFAFNCERPLPEEKDGNVLNELLTCVAVR
jgi:hypothetical protein